MNKSIDFRWVKNAASAALQILLVQDGRLLAPDGLSAAAQQELNQWLKNAKFEGDVAACARPAGLSATYLLLGLGKAKDFHAARWLRGWTTVGRELAKDATVQRAALAWPAKAEFPVAAPQLLGLAVEGLLAGSYLFETFKTKKKTRRFGVDLVGAEVATAAARAAVRRAEITAATLREVRELANLPANEFGPREVAMHAKRLAKAAGVSCRVWDQAALKKEKCGALLAVAQGSRRPGCLIRLAYAGTKRQKPLVVVGKAVTFDTGGISLKPSKNMEWMKYDKSGGMAALATVLLAARWKIARPVVAYIPAVENMPGGNATRPGDIVTARNGKTIEVLNTDAEGRLILADALDFAAAEKPAAIVDIATLTGAVIIALGYEATAVMGNDDRLILDLMLAGETTGERLWQLPLWNEYDQMLQGQFADIKNIGDGTAGTIAGGAFLRQFVPEGIPWAHLDIAGTAWHETATAAHAPGATLVPARLLAEWAANFRLDA